MFLSFYGDFDWSVAKSNPFLHLKSVVIVVHTVESLSCFISFPYLDLYLLGDDTSIS